MRCSVAHGLCCLNVSVFVQRFLYKFLTFRQILLNVYNQFSFYTVNSEFFARVLFSQNFEEAKFRENKTFAK